MASHAVPCPKSASVARSGTSPQTPRQNVGKISFPLYSFGFQWPNRKRLTALKVKAKLNEVTAEKSSNSGLDAKSGATISKESNGSAAKLGSEKIVPDASSISAFMSQVSNLVKLVDAKDIMELQLKQMDCEITIRKKEAIQQPLAAASVAAQPTPVSHAMFSPPPSAAPIPALSAAPAGSGPATPALPALVKQSSSSHPPLKCPMAGTFYRSPGPGEPPFVKVGDKVQKGQVVCIIEAMKLMNEIEADQTGTVAEILAEDGKPVSVDVPLFVIVP
ncbi:biotin carboxyl carrier protein of acetyl-CoA carboxylase 2, chloroplastic-like [Syzygium oleosum]|uniref:biotin carboxyl carrier protein of acetyl-CoA carboxylase 2, chloroplastic-like n=1 Tax=Syzygium oleosum TaxID=219896 RepID=UPI0011D1A2E2|nr:biotin carboxyl carrier protein of acetyl-CoA carboxylase 2, chloroplastic-like [Syzygium oleosum]